MSEVGDDLLLRIRPEISMDLNGLKNPDELFMHKTLRPILKLQHPKIILFIESTQHFDKQKCTTNNKEINHHYLKTFVSKNLELKHQLLGLIFGMFTIEELQYYTKNKLSVSKRTNEMIVGRYLSSLS